MIKKMALPAILILAVAILGASVASAIKKHNAIFALDDMAAGIYAIEQEIHTAVDEIFQEYEIEVPDEESSSTIKGRRPRADLTNEQRTAIREKVVEMRKAGADRKEIRNAVVQMLKDYGIEVPDGGFRRIRGRQPKFRDRNI